MSSYRDLEIYKKSYELALRVHRLTLQLPQFELYEEGGQARYAGQAENTPRPTDCWGRKGTESFVFSDTDLPREIAKRHLTG